MQKKFVLTMLAVATVATVSAQATSLAPVTSCFGSTPTSYEQILQQLQCFDTLCYFNGDCDQLQKPENQAPVHKPVHKPELAPDTAPDESPDEAPEIEPDIAPDESPDLEPEDEPDIAPDVTPDVAPNPSPDTSDPAPETAPDTAPEVDNSMAQQVLALVNEERADAGLTAVQLDTSVQQAATVRATELASLFSHTRPDGSSCFTALLQAGVNYQGAGENIAYGQQTAQAVMTAWMNSTGHRENILNSKFTTLGVGYELINGTPYWVQLFTY